MYIAYTLLLISSIEDYTASRFIVVKDFHWLKKNIYT